MQKENKKTIVAAFAALFLFLTIFSIFYVTIEAEHECTGHDDCPICHVIEIVVQNFKLLGCLLAVTAIASSVSMTFAKKACKCVNHFFTITSLISQKIRIND